MKELGRNPFFFSFFGWFGGAMPGRATLTSGPGLDCGKCRVFIY